MSVRISDVAKKAGVSVTSVSRVLNGGKYVREELRTKVLNAVNELGYTPSSIARSLVLQKTNMIGVIIPDLTSSFHSTILSSIEEVASKNSYSLLVSNIAENIEKEKIYLNAFKQMRVSGIIIMHEKVNAEIIKMFNSMKIPLVFSSVRPKGVENFTSIVVNNTRAAYDATKYLIGLGHRRIAFIGGDMNDVTSGQERYEGFTKAMKDNGLKVEQNFVKFGDYKVNDGYCKMNEILKSKPYPTAVFAASDDMAAGVINAIVDRGMRVPDDISVMGFDGSNFTDYIRPRLTSMEQPIREIGRLSVELLIKQINGEERFLNEVIVAHKLVERDSCRKIADCCSETRKIGG